ncbi:MFS transporter [Knoellia locipacati]|uniref:MFS transporter n=1 Tax=Knoellia locipacati TaxID=882824 RepID=UPI00384B0BDC
MTPYPRSHVDVLGVPIGTPHSARSRRTLLSLMLVAQLMVILDISAVNVALPSMAADLGIGSSDIGWVITSYSLVFGSLLLLGGRAADLLGRRRTLLTGLAIFTASSFAAAMVATGSGLFVARAGQGLGAALVSPAALSVIMATFREGQARASALAAWGAVSGAGAAVGVLFGGVLTQYIDWRAIFFINLPVGLVLAVGAQRLVAQDDREARWRGLDLPGAILASASLGTLVYAVSQADSVGWTSAQTWGLGLASLLGLAGFAAVETRTSRPLLRIATLADRAVSAGFLLMLTASALLFGSFLLVSLYLQSVLDTDPLGTGLAFLPMAATLAIGVHLAGQLIGSRGIRVPMVVGFAVASAGMLFLSNVGAQAAYLPDILPGMAVLGLGLGIVLVSVSVAVMTGAHDDEVGMLSGLNTTGHEIGGSLGVAVLVTIATTSIGASQDGLADGIGQAFFVAAVASLLAAALAVFLLPPARAFLPKFRSSPRVSLH